MEEWNALVSVHERGYSRACEWLKTFGTVRRTEFYNVLIMKVDDVHTFMETLREQISRDPGILCFLHRVVPLTHTFRFQTPEDFETRTKRLVLLWLSRLAGKRFHVRMHRRGFKGRLSSMDEESFLDKVLVEALEEAGTPGYISFENPEVIVAVETIGQRGGLSIWTHEDLEKYPFVGLD